MNLISCITRSPKFPSHSIQSSIFIRYPKFQDHKKVDFPKKFLYRHSVPVHKLWSRDHWHYSMGSSKSIQHRLSKIPHAYWFFSPFFHFFLIACNEFFLFLNLYNSPLILMAVQPWRFWPRTTGETKHGYVMLEKRPMSFLSPNEEHRGRFMGKELSIRYHHDLWISWFFHHNIRGHKTFIEPTRMREYTGRSCSC